MKIAISNIAWQHSEDKHISALMHRYQITGIEIAPTKIWPDPISVAEKDLSAYKLFWTKQGITPVATQSILFGHPELTIFQDKTTQQATLNYLKKMIRVSASLGAKVIVFGSPKNRVIGKTDRSIAADFFYALGEAAKDHEVFFCVEPNAKAYNTDFVTNTQEGIDFVKLVDHPNLRLHLDAGVMTINRENYAASIAAALPYLCHFHISEPFLELTGSQDTNHHAIAKALQDADYQGWVSIEMKQGVLPSNFAAVERSLAFVTEIYR